MTKQHFIALADTIKTHNHVAANNGNNSVVGPQIFTPEQIDTLAGFCAAQNPQFNRERWLGYIKGTNGSSGGKVKTPTA